MSDAVPTAAIDMPTLRACEGRSSYLDRRLRRRAFGIIVSHDRHNNAEDRVTCGVGGGALITPGCELVCSHSSVAERDD